KIHRFPAHAGRLRLRRRARRGAGHRPRQARRSAPVGRAMRPQVLAAGLVAGLVLANVARVGAALCLLLAAGTAALVPRGALVAAPLVLLGWGWGGVRLAPLHPPALAPHPRAAGRRPRAVARPPPRGP